MRTLLAALFLLSASSLNARDSPEVFNQGGRVSMPMLVKEVKPEYTPEARAAKIEGDVQMSAVVLTLKN